MKTRMTLLGFFILALAGCNTSSQPVTRVGNPSSLTTLADLPELDISRYDTSSAGYAAPAAWTVKGVTSTGQFSRVGCDSKYLKNGMIVLGAFAEGFLCLYKTAESHYPDDFTIPTDDFNYYTLLSGDDTVVGRIGHFPGGFGEVDEEVLVLDECESGARTAEMRITASNATEDLAGSGYTIQLTEEDYDQENPNLTDEALSFTLDTRNAVWEASISYHHDLDGIEYGTLTLSFDTENSFNTLIASTHDDDPNGLFDISNNVVFGPWTELEGFTIGGSAIVNVIQSPNQDPEIGQIAGFVFNDSATLPAIRLDFQTEDGSDLPFFTELAALGDPPSTIVEPTISYRDEWDCTIPSGRTAVTIDLTPEGIAEDLEACESVDLPDDLDCAALQEL